MELHRPGSPSRRRSGQSRSGRPSPSLWDWKDAPIGSFEIERKFLVAGVPRWLSEYESRRIEQGYLAIAGDVEVRLRRAGDETLLTVKRGKGEVRREEEIELDDDQFEALWPLTEGRRLRKRRSRIPLSGSELVAEVDVFEGDLEGLVVAEVEAPTEAEAESLRPPAWFGPELTGDARFSGASLAEHGAPHRA